jgi:ADP-ribose pyrophosphatase
VFSNRWLEIRKNRYPVPYGPIIDDYFILHRPDFILAVPYYQGQLVLVRQYRPATGRCHVAPPAGYIEEGESPEDAAVREVLEETGCTVITVRVIGQLDALPAYLSSKTRVVECQVTGEIQPRDTTEILQAFAVSWEEALRMVRAGEICEMPAVAAILLAKESSGTLYADLPYLSRAHASTRALLAQHA